MQNNGIFPSICKVKLRCYQCIVQQFSILFRIKKYQQNHENKKNPSDMDRGSKKENKNQRNLRRKEIRNALTWKQTPGHRMREKEGELWYPKVTKTWEDSGCEIQLLIRLNIWQFQRETTSVSKWKLMGFFFKELKTAFSTIINKNGKFCEAHNHAPLFVFKIKKHLSLSPTTMMPPFILD